MSRRLARGRVVRTWVVNRSWVAGAGKEHLLMTDVSLLKTVSPDELTAHGQPPPGAAPHGSACHQHPTGQVGRLLDGQRYRPKRPDADRPLVGELRRLVAVL